MEVTKKDVSRVCNTAIRALNESLEQRIKYERTKDKKGKENG